MRLCLNRRWALRDRRGSQGTQTLSRGVPRTRQLALRFRSECRKVQLLYQRSLHRRLALQSVLLVHPRLDLPSVQQVHPRLTLQSALQWAKVLSAAHHPAHQLQVWWLRLSPRSPSGRLLFCTRHARPRRYQCPSVRWKLRMYWRKGHSRRHGFSAGRRLSVVRMPPSWLLKRHKMLRFEVYRTCWGLLMVYGMSLLWLPTDLQSRL